MSYPSSFLYFPLFQKCTIRCPLRKKRRFTICEIIAVQRRWHPEALPLQALVVWMAEMPVVTLKWYQVFLIAGRYLVKNWNKIKQCIVQGSLKSGFRYYFQRIFLFFNWIQRDVDLENKKSDVTNFWLLSTLKLSNRQNF